MTDSISALIGVGGSVLGSVTTWALTRPASVRNDLYDKVTGSITEPKPGIAVGKTIQCSGKATGLQPGLSLWLAVEAGPLLWPKKNRPILDQDNNWSVTIFEDGRSKVISIALFIADNQVCKRIEKWLKAGVRRGNFPELTGIRGARRIARVDSLRVT